MEISKYFTAFLMFLIGTTVGTIVALVGEFFGVSGWIAGPFLVAFVLIFIYVDDRLTGFGMKHWIKFLAKLENTELTVADEKQIEKSFTLRYDSFGFLAGTVFGILASFFGMLSLVFDWLQF